MDAFKASNTFGPGGYKCHCCGPAPKHRARFRRMARRHLQRDTQAEIRMMHMDNEADLREIEAFEAMEIQYLDAYEKGLMRDLLDDPDPYEDVGDPYNDYPGVYPGDDDSWEVAESWPV